MMGLDEDLHQIRRRRQHRPLRRRAGGKSDARIECYGTVDELNASLGVAAVAAPSPLVDSLRRVQNELFVVGAHLATPEDSPHTGSLPLLDEAMIGRLEMEIDNAEAELEPLRQFILPGGAESARAPPGARSAAAPARAG